MGFSIFAIILAFVLIVICIGFSIARHKSFLSVTTKQRGTPTERDLVRRLVAAGIPPVTIFHDLYVNNGRGRFSQLDIVVATKVGILVIEVKKYSGWIYGHVEQTMWTQVLAFGKHKYRLYNPILQNRQHIKKLRLQLDQFNYVPFYTLIVIYGKYELKNIKKSFSDGFIINPGDFESTLKKILKEGEAARYTNKREIVDCLNRAVKNGESSEIRHKHQENIQQRFKQ